jgi:hypothetical protein
MVDFPPAANPWQEGLLPPHIFGNKDSSTAAYKAVINFLRDWPGQPTVTQEEIRERHNRFVQIVGGYPLINGRFPLDWPLHPASKKALNLSLFFDTIEVKDGISLRTYILELDLRFRENSKDTSWSKINKECTSIFISTLRHGTVDEFTAIEESFLAALHSTESDRLAQHWPTPNDVEETISNLPSLYPAEVDDVDRQEKMKMKQYESNNPQKYSRLQNQMNESKKWTDYRKSPGYRRSEIIFEFKYIQTWMNEHWLHTWYANKEEESVGQRFIRGLSVMCELAMSRIRQCIIREYGTGSIIVDGGGRITCAVPEKKAKKAAIKIEEAFTHMFLDEFDRSFLQQEVEAAFNAHVNRIKIPKYRNDRPKKKEEYEKQLGVAFVKAIMPPRRIYSSTDKDVPHPRLTIPPKPRPTSSPSCLLCEGRDVEWSSLQKQINNDENEFCMLHRLAFIVGTNQRRRDSILRMYSPQPTGFPNQENRRISYLSAIDANSLGYMFQHNQNKNVTPEQRFTQRRRRSFRFNAKWYLALCNSLDYTKKYGNDRIAAWICAGDDLLLAQYGPSDNPLDEFLKYFSRRLAQDFTEIDFAITFSGGIKERPKGKGINTAISTVLTLEKAAKLEWKTRIEKIGLRNPYLMKLDSHGVVEEKKFQRLKGKQLHYGNRFGNIFSSMSKGFGPKSLIRSEMYPIKCDSCEVEYELGEDHQKVCEKRGKSGGKKMLERPILYGRRKTPLSYNDVIKEQHRKFKSI